jgi:hypothetical protein
MIFERATVLRPGLMPGSEKSRKPGKIAAALLIPLTCFCQQDHPTIRRGSVELEVPSIGPIFL